MILVLTLLLALRSLPAEGAGSVSGVVKDSSGASVAKARIALLSGDRDVWGNATSDASGRFEIKNVVPGRYLLVAKSAGFRDLWQAVALESGKTTSVEMVLGAPALAEEVTVTADRGGVQSVEGQPQPVTLITEDAILSRSKAVVAQAANEEASVHLQRTSPTIAGIYVRGLTGKNVNVFVDGVRYTTSAQRSGINTFLDLIEPSSLESIEVLRGPQSAQYGSDALGGSIQFQTRAPTFSAEGRQWEGRFAAQANSADTSFGGSLGGAYSARRFGLDLSAAGRRIGETRPGQGIDSRNAVTRFLGLPSSLATGPRLPDTDFDQYAGQLKAAWSPADGAQLRASYLRSQQDGGKRWDQLLGGDGNLVADLRNLMLDNVQLKYDRLRFGFFDELSLGYSWNAQREERVNQGGNGDVSGAVTHEYEKMRVHGAQALLRKQARQHSLALGGDFYAEGITAPSFSFDPPGGIAVRRGRVPDGARYRSGGLYVQDAFEVLPERLRVQGALRFSHVSYRARAADSPLVNGRPLWPDDAYATGSLTFRAGAAYQPAPRFSLTASLARGFRAPHITDLGTYGLTGSGYEVAAPDVAGLRATLGSSAGQAAVSSGIPVSQVVPESSLSYDVGVSYRSGRLRARVGAFANDIDDNLVKLALILPPGAVGAALGDQLITSQAAGGAVFVPAATAPVLVRANFDDARIYGVEADVEARPSARFSAAFVLTYLYAKDKRTGLPPNIEGGTPAPDAWLKLRYQSPRGRFWVEPYLHAALEQDRLSTLDLEDRRTGATRSRASIASFFQNGALARGFVGAGPDGRLRTADDALLATGETLAQVQARVLGTADSAPLYTSVAGYAVLGVRGGARLGRHELLLDVENIGDRNYRGVSWGIDAPGRGVYLRYATRF